MLHAGPVPRLRARDRRAPRERQRRGRRALAPGHRTRARDRHPRARRGGRRVGCGAAHDAGAGRHAQRTQAPGSLCRRRRRDSGRGSGRRRPGPLARRGRRARARRDAAQGDRHDPAGRGRRARGGAGDQDRGGSRGDRPRARRGARPPRGRRVRRCPPLPRHDGQVRAHARAVRPADRRLPGRQAPARRPRGRPGPGALAVVVRGACLRPHPRARRAARRDRQGAPDRPLRPRHPGRDRAAFLGEATYHRLRAADLAGW